VEAWVNLDFVANHDLPQSRPKTTQSLSHRLYKRKTRRHPVKTGTSILVCQQATNIPQSGKAATSGALLGRMSVHNCRCQPNSTE